MAKVHHLKAHPSAFEAVRSGLKPWEYRRNDRDFQVGDMLALLEWDPHYYSTPNRAGRYTDRTLTAKVTFILHGGQFEIPVGYCIMTIELLQLSSPAT